MQGSSAAGPDHRCWAVGSFTHLWSFCSHHLYQQRRKREPWGSAAAKAGKAFRLRFVCVSSAVADLLLTCCWLAAGLLLRHAYYAIEGSGQMSLWGLHEYEVRCYLLLNHGTQCTIWKGTALSYIMRG